MSPRVAIVVPAYRCEAYLGATLQSILDQTFTSWECVVVDDGSPDRAGEIAERFAAGDSRFRVVRQSNAGVAAARNTGLGRISPSAEMITCMDSDDVYLPHALARLVGELDRRPDVVACHALGEFIDEGGNSVSGGEFAAIGRARATCVGGRIARLPVDADSTFANVLTASTMFPPGLLLTRRSVVDRVGGYDVRHVPADDWDMYIRIARFGSIAFIDEVILSYRRHDRNQGALGIVPEMCRRVFHKAFYSAENSPEHCRIVRESWRATQRSLVDLRWREAVAQACRGRIDKALLSLGRIPFIVARYVRGRPTHGWF